MTICSRAIGYCFPIVFLLLCNPKIPKQGIEIQFFFLNRLWRFLKKLANPVKLHSSAPRAACLLQRFKVMLSGHDFMIK